MAEQTKPIPQPPPKLIVGNIFDVDPENGIQSICDLMKTYGPIMKLAILNKKIVTVGNQALVHEVCDQSRFEKIVQGPLEHVRVLAGDGLFTAHQREESWDIAHRILVPAFGPLSIRNMFPGMVDIADQLVAKWHRFAGQKIDVVADFTRLTLDTIAFCTFSHRFNSFYSETSPPFVEAMFRSLKASGVRNRRLPGTSWAYRASDKQLAEDVKLQHDTADELVKERVESKEDKGDLLDVMLKGRDPKTGKGLSQENIRYQLVTFLIAGHETTSGMLSFLFHYLLQHPEAARKIKEEVDRVAGSGPIEYSHLQKFEYIDAALKETLRLRSTAPAFSVTPKNGPEVIGGSYLVEQGQSVVVVLDALHRDPAVWGNDAEAFRPERMLNDGFKNLPPDAWKPFGNGMRGCIGRPFAWQESLLVVAMLFQHFDFRPYNTSYELKIKTALTIKPNDFYMYIQPRKDRQFTASSLQPASGSTGASSTTPEDAKVENAGGKGPKLYVYYGSNAGTCKALAQKLVDTASRRGVKVEISQLNDASDGHLPKDGPVAIITASYDGQPTDDANFFYQWLIKAEGDAAKGIKYGVFGCGHPDWQATFHAVPTKIDERLIECGGQRLVARGSGNAAASELFEEFDDWEETFLKSAFSSDISTASAEKDTLVATVDKESRQNTLSYGHLQPALVVSNEVISQDSKEIKRHISIKLPVGTTYRTGDYMALLPTTPRPFVMRALNRFKLHPDDAITLQGGGKTFNLPLNTSISAFDLFAGFVELSQPVSVRRIERLVELLRDGGEGLKKYLDPAVFEAEIVQKRISFLDLLEEFPDIDIPLGEFLLALPPIRLRQYSVSSSPLDDPTMATLTISAIASPHLSGRGTMYYGTATTFLSNCIPGTYIRMSIRPSSSAFHPPLDPSVPILMGCAGSGIAPFRGFVQERALQKAAGRNVGKALLFYGCHGPTTDALYDEEMKKWEAEGVVSVRHAFSRSTEDSKGCKYVQDRIWHDREEAKEMFHKGARVYICGSTPLAKGVKEVCARIYAEHKGVDISAAEEWMRSIEAERFATDVFA